MCSKAQNQRPVEAGISMSITQQSKVAARGLWANSNGFDRDVAGVEAALMPRRQIEVIGTLHVHRELEAEAERR